MLSTNAGDLEKLIIKHIPRDALMAFEDAYFSGDAKGRSRASDFEKGHRPSAAGQNKHFSINESFFDALQAHGADPSPLRGTKLVIGKLGIFNIARLNVPGHQWVDLGRSSTRKKLADQNHAINKKFIQADLFQQDSELTAGTIFIVGIMDGADENNISQLTQVMLALPAPNMKSWLYISTIADFLKIYDEADAVAQVDNAKPILRTITKKKTGNEQGNN
ncbi:hypothetical protein [Herbaspirillum sp. RV1423]|uniref:hypothetical protein n=1 Tax=Herbaspirillum sp. RV1423 TaxID=1443993 RepID=UPI0005549E96|nr:hypothetical protein [Herbaspirillum sp. RV1423]